MQTATDEEDADNEQHSNSADTPIARLKTDIATDCPQKAWKASKLKATISAILILTLLFVYTSFRSFTHHDPANASACRMAYMSPGYIRMDSLDAQHSRLAGKYSLWFYREQGWDLSIKPHGTPVLFAPGNAGSYRQVRSLAAAAARMYYESPGIPRRQFQDAGAQELDFFAADFNEDFSAFHAATLMEQAEFLADSVKFILNLYRNEPNPPTSVIVLAHSMGGIASRLVLLEPQLPADSIKTIITLSTPHVIPPATFDGGLDAIYERINGYWRSVWEQETHALRDVLLLSIAGGTADTTVSSDYSDISQFTPSTNGFAMLTSSIPSVRTPVDHLAMMWCDQLRQIVVALLLHTVDAAIPSRARPLAFRLEVAQTLLLDSLDHVSAPPTAGGSLNLAVGEIVAIKETYLSISLEEQSKTIYYSFSGADETTTSLQILSELDPADIRILSCDGSLGDKQSLKCRSLEGLKWHELPVGVRGVSNGPDTAFFLDVSTGDHSLQVAIGVKASRQGALLASLGSVRSQNLSNSLFRLATIGCTTETTLKVSDKVHFPQADSSLLAYSVKVRLISGQPKSSALLRMSAAALHESRYVPDASSATVQIHSTPPFLPPVPASGLTLQLWHDPTCQYEISVKVDWYASLGKLVIRYRSLVAAWPAAFPLLLLLHHIQGADYTRGMQDILGRDLRILLIAACSCAVLQAIISRLGGSSFTYDLLLGVPNIFFVWLAPLLLIVSAGVHLVFQLCLRGLVLGLAKVWRFAIRTPYLRVRRPEFHENASGINRRRIAAFGILILWITLFAPHQFAFLTLFLIQLDNVVRCATVESTQKNHDCRFEQNATILSIMFLLLPQNGAILAVWLRNLQAGYYAPFPSDHNVFSILGWLLLVEHLQSGKTLRIGDNRFMKHAVSSVIEVAVGTFVIYGARYNYLVGNVCNLVALALCVAHHVSIRYADCGNQS